MDWADILADRTGQTRRTILIALGAGATGLAGCGARTESTETPTQTETRTRQKTTQPTTQEPTQTPPEETPNEDSQTPDEDETPSEDDPEPETGRIQFIPKNASGDEDWLANPLFDDDKFNGDITYKVNIPEARQHRSIVEDQAERYPEVETLVNNFWDSQWRIEFRQRYKESVGEDYAIGKIDTELLQTSKPLDKRIIDSNLHKFLLGFEEFNNDWEISSTYRDALAAMVQEVIDPARETTLVAPHTVADLDGGSHGMNWAIQNYTDYRSNYRSDTAFERAKQQEQSFLIDTAFQGDRKYSDGCENIKESDYTEPGTWENQKFEHFALYNGQPVQANGFTISEEEMRMYVGRGLFGHSFNNSHHTSLHAELDKEFVQEIADYAMNPTDSTLTGRFLLEYASTIRDMDERDQFEDKTLKIGRDYVEVLREEN